MVMFTRCSLDELVDTLFGRGDAVEDGDDAAPDVGSDARALEGHGADVQKELIDATEFEPASGEKPVGRAR